MLDYMWHISEDDLESIEIVDIEEIPLTYLPSNALRVKVKAVGNLI